MSSPEARVQHLASGHMALAQADYVSSMYSHSLTGTPYGTVPSALESPSASKAYLHMSQTTITSGYVPLACDQPFQSECMRIIATFLKPGAAKELPLDPDVRETAVRDLAWNTHPDAVGICILCHFRRKSDIVRSYTVSPYLRRDILYPRDDLPPALSRCRLRKYQPAKAATVVHPRYPRHRRRVPPRHLADHRRTDPSRGKSRMETFLGRPRRSGPVVHIQRAQRVSRLPV